MSSACTPDETSTRCCGPPDSGGSISTVTGAASRSRPTAYGSLRSEPCHSASREQDVRRTSDLEWPGAELRLDRVDAACEECVAYVCRYRIEADGHRPPSRGHVDIVLRVSPGGRLIESHHADLVEAGLLRDRSKGIRILDRPAGDELIACPRHRRQRTADHTLEDGLRLARPRGIDGHACAHPRTGLYDPLRFCQRSQQVRDELQPMATDRGMERRIRKAKVLHVHQLEAHR